MCLWGTRADRLPGGRARGRSAGDARAGVLREDAPELPRPLGLGRSSATLSPPSRKEDRAGAWDVSHGRGGTRPRTLSLGLDAPSGARLPRTAGCCAARPVTRHPAAPPGPAAGLLCVSPARRPGACPLTLPLRTHTGRCPRPAPVTAQAAVPRGWGHDAVCDVDVQPGAGAWAPPPVHALQYRPQSGGSGGGPGWGPRGRAAVLGRGPAEPSATWDMREGGSEPSAPGRLAPRPPREPHYVSDGRVTATRSTESG